MKRHTGRSESQDEDDCMGENCNEDNKSSDRDVSEDEDVSEEGRVASRAYRERDVIVCCYWRLITGSELTCPSEFDLPLIQMRRSLPNRTLIPTAGSQRNRPVILTLTA